MNGIPESQRPAADTQRLLGRHWVPIALRLAGIVCALLINLLVARQLTLDQIAYYYLYATLAYFGNAGIYVGLGVVLQRLCASLASSSGMPKLLFLRYLGISLACGTSAVILFSGVYLLARGGGSGSWYIALWCATLSGATYLSNVGKDLLALSRKLHLAALFGMVEQVLRVGLIGMAIACMHTRAIDVTAATALASLVSGVAAITVLLLSNSDSHGSGAAVPSAKDVAATVAPVGFSALLNWLQLQSYRPILLYSGARPEAIAIASLLTTLGMTGANPILVVTGQTYIPRIYAGESAAFRKCMLALARMALALAVASAPAALAFLYLSGRRMLWMYLALVPMGVLIEAGNNFIGAFIHRQNATRGSMWVFAAAGSVGVLIALASWAIPVSQELLPYLIGFGLVASQIATVGINYVLTSRGAVRRFARRLE